MLANQLRKALEIAAAMRGSSLRAPLDEADIKGISLMLQEYRLPPLPDDYRAFLSVTDGFVGLNYVLWGLKPIGHEPPVLAGTIRGILRDEIIDKRSLVVGSIASDRYLIYNPANKTYQALAEYDRPYREHKDLLSFIEEKNRITAERLAPLSATRN